MFRTSILSLALFALPGLAQSTANVTWDPDNQERFNAADCESTDPLTFTWDTLGGGGAYDFYVTYEFDGDCDPADNNILTPDNGESIPMFSLVAQPTGILYNDEVTPDIFLPTEACFGDSGARNIVGVMCFTLYDTALTDPRSRRDVFARNVIYDTTIPLTPTINDFTASDGAAKFTAIEPGGAELDDGEVSIFVLLRGCDSDADIPADFEASTLDFPSASTGDAGVDCAGEVFSLDQTSTTVSFNGLSTSSQYEVAIFAEDDLGNRSALSDTVRFDAIAEIGPLSTYQGTGTPYGFDCSQSGGAPTLLGALALLGLLGIRRAGRRASALVVVAVLASAVSASAAPGRITTDLFIGPYLPDLDRDPGANGLYSCFFNDATVPELGADVTVGLFDAFGSLELGIGLSASQVSGKTFNRDSLSTGCDSPIEGGLSQLSVLKLRPQLAYRFDWLLDEFGVPLVPYGEVGLVGLGYAFTRNGAFDDGSGAAPAGALFGWEGVLGLALELSFLDAIDPFTPNTAKRARARGSFLHPFLFAEAAFQEVDNFGGGGFVFSPRDDLLGTGLPMMLRFGVRLEM